MQIIKQLIETLKMELGIIQVKETTDLIKHPRIRDLPVNVVVKEPLQKLCEDSLSVNSLHLGDQMVKIRNLISKADISVKQEMLTCKTNTSQLFFSREIPLSIKSESNLNFAEVLNGKMIIAQIKSKNLPVLWISRFHSSPLPKNEKSLRALEKFFTEYRGNLKDIKFIGYYRFVPLDSMKRFLVLGKELIIELSDKKSKRYDAIIFKNRGR
ncbi:hypothetical protein, partial [Pseudothermotoga lettingae]